MSLPFDLKRGGGWLIPVTILSVVLGMLLAAALKTQQNIRNSSIPSNRFSNLASAYLDEKNRNKQLERSLAEERAKIAGIEQSQGEGNSRVKLLQEELNKMKLSAGLVPVEGQGVEVVLQDFPGRIPRDTPAVLRDQYIIHDVDLRDTVNELYANGAEVISIGDGDTEQRLISSTAIRCVGGTIQINGVDMTSPFTIKAIGPSNAMQKGLTMIGGLVDNWRPIQGIAGKMISVKQQKNLYIAAYTGDVSRLFIWAKVAESKGGRD